MRTGTRVGCAARSATKRALVDCGGTGDHLTIGEAVADGADGDVIDVAPCRYAEQVDFGGRTIMLRAQSGPADTIIDAGGAGPVVVAQGGEGEGTGLIGFTLTGGQETAYGAAVFVDLSTIRLEDVEVTGNTGAAILYSHSGAVALLDVTFGDNSSTAEGASIVTYRGTLNATGLAVGCGDSAHAVYLGHGSALIDASTVVCPSGTAMHWEHTTGRLERTRVDGLVVVIGEQGHDTDVVTMENNLFTGGAGVYISDGTALIRNSTVIGVVTLVRVLEPVVEANIFAGGGCGIDADADTTGLAPRDNDFWSTDDEPCDGAAWSGVDGNLAVDPRFSDEAAGDHTLAVGSPCIDAGLTEREHDDVDGSRNDMGAYGGPKTLAGGW